MPRDQPPGSAATSTVTNGDLLGGRRDVTLGPGGWRAKWLGRPGGLTNTGVRLQGLRPVDRLEPQISRCRESGEGVRNRQPDQCGSDRVFGRRRRRFDDRGDNGLAERQRSR